MTVKYAVRRASALRRLGGDAGQTATEYLGMLTVVAVIVAVLAASGIAAMARAYVSSIVCDILNRPCGTAAQESPEHATDG